MDDRSAAGLQVTAAPFMFRLGHAAAMLLLGILAFTLHVAGNLTLGILRLLTFRSTWIMAMAACGVLAVLFSNAYI